MNKTCAILAVILLALGATLPAAAQAAAASSPARGRDLIRLGAAEGEGEAGEEGQEAEEGEGKEESEESEAEEESEEEGEAGSSKRHKDARREYDSPRLTSLALTHAVLAALRHGRLRASGVCFDFTLSETAKVQAVLETQSHSSGHASWQTVSQVTLSGRHGSNLGHFSGHGALVAGYDRLTLTPAHGSPRTVEFRVR